MRQSVKYGDMEDEYEGQNERYPQAQMNTYMPSTTVST